MASGKTLNAVNLEALGAARLAALLLEVSAGSAAAKRRLRLALALARVGHMAAEKAAAEIAKGLASISKGRSLIDWQQVKPLVADLQAQRRAILDLVAPTDPYEAFALTWRLVACSASVFARSDDGSGRLAAFFRDAVRDLGPRAQAAKVDPTALAGRTFEVLSKDQYGVWHELVSILAPQLGAPGLSQLRNLTTAWQAEQNVDSPDHKRRVVGWSSAGKVYANKIEADNRWRAGQFILQRIADVAGDIDDYIAHTDEAARKTPTIAAGIASRLLGARRPEEALAALDAVERDKYDQFPLECEQSKIEALEALGRHEDAQNARWAQFLKTLNANHLRNYLTKPHDFDEIDGEQHAMAHALTHRDIHQALGFFVAWPELEQASQLVLARARELNGELYKLLTSASDALEDRYPLASTLVRRAMIDFTLSAARASRYKHAAGHLANCASLALKIDSFGDQPDHKDYVQTLRATHNRKAGFWQEVDGL